MDESAYLRLVRRPRTRAPRRWAWCCRKWRRSRTWTRCSKSPAGSCCSKSAWACSGSTSSTRTSGGACGPAANLNTLGGQGDLRKDEEGRAKRTRENGGREKRAWRRRRKRNQTHTMQSTLSNFLQLSMASFLRLWYRRFALDYNYTKTIESRKLKNKIHTELKRQA